VATGNRYFGSAGVRALRACALALLLPLVAGSLPAAAQSSGLQVTSVSADRWPGLETTVTVVDGSGQPVTGLTQESFAGSIDGVALPLQGLQTTSDPGVGVAVVLAFDVSGSMQGAPIENARAAGRALVAQLGPTDQAAVIAFSDQTVVVQSFTQDKGVLNGAIDRLIVGGNTSLFAAVQESTRLADSAPLPRRAVVLLSDGLDYGGIAVDPQAALASVETGSAVFMSIGLGDAIDQDYLARLAAAGRGQFRLAPTPEALTALYQETALVLRQQYVLTFDASGVPPAAAHGKTIQISAAVGDGVLTGEAPLTLPAALLTTPGPTAPPTAPPRQEPEPETEPAAESSGSIVPYVVLVLAGGVVVAAGTVFAWRRRRRSAEEQAAAGLERLAAERLQVESPPLSYPAIARAATGETGAWLETPDRRVPLDGTPVTVGFTSDCMVTLATGAGSSTERVRIWLRDGSYMLHNLSRTGSVTIAGRPVTWAVLEDGDEIHIGGSSLVFRAAAPSSEI